MKLNVSCNSHVHKGRFLMSTWKLTRLTTLFIVISSMQLEARVFAQNVTINKKHISIKAFLYEVKKQTGYSFLADKSILDKAQNVAIDLNNISLKNALDLTFRDLPYSYSIEGRLIIVKEKTYNTSNKDVYLNAAVVGHDLKVHVVDSIGQPISGVSVSILGAKQIVQTDNNGYVTLTNVQNDIVISVKSIGYETMEVKVGSQQNIAVFLKEKITPLDEVQLIAYGTTTKRLNVGSVGHVSAEEIAKQPVTNVLQALQGRVPGLLVKQTAGYGSAPFSVQVRGQNSIVYASDPLFVIDGVPMLAGAGDTKNLGLDKNFMVGNIGQSPIFGINPSDIASVDVLKDAAATAIYGSQGANGVILITTKKGSTDGTKVSVDFYSGAGKVTRLPKLLNTQQYLDIRKEAFKNDNITPTFANAPDLLKWDQNRYTDWQKVLLGNTATMTDAQASISNGDNYTQYRISGGYHDERTITTASGSDKRGSMSLSLNSQSKNHKFSLSFTGSFSNAHSNLLSLDNSLTILPPNAPPIFDKNGNLDFVDWGSFSLGFFGFTGSNPFGSLLQPYNASTDNLQSRLQMQYRPINDLVIRVSGGYSNLNNTQTYVKPIKSMNPASSPTSNTSFGSNGVKTWLVEPQAEYNKVLGKSRLNVLVGGTLQSTLTTGSNIYATNFPNEGLLLNLQSAKTVTIYGSTKIPYRYDALFGRINYNWDYKYLLDLTARRDGSSRFGPGNQFGNFGAVGAGWIFTEEAFFKKNLHFLNFGKIRGSYGTTGSANIGDYQYLSQWKTTQYAYDNTATLAPSAQYNPDYGWEVNKKLEFALELSFFQNRLQSTFSWYENRSSNQLVSIPLPAYTGFPSVTANLPATVQNTGVEGYFNATVIQKKDFQWNVNLNFTIPRNKLVSFPGLTSSSYANTYEIGKPLSIQRKIHFTGVDPQTGKPNFLDVNGDGQITTYGASNDLQGRYSLAPTLFGGIGNNINYKNWNLSFFFQFTQQKGTKYFYSIGAPGSMNNQSVDILSRWQKPGDVTNIPKVATAFNTDYSNYSTSDAGITGASFARLQNLSLAYNLPTKWVKKYHGQYTRIYIQGQNLLTITKYKGADPDTQSATAIPPVKYLTGGIQLIF